MAKHQGRCTINFHASRYTILQDLRSQFTGWFNKAKNFQSQADLKMINIESLRKEMEAEKETLNDEMKVVLGPYVFTDPRVDESTSGSIITEPKLVNSKMRQSYPVTDILNMLVSEWDKWLKILKNVETSDFQQWRQYVKMLMRESSEKLQEYLQLDFSVEKSPPPDDIPQTETKEKYTETRETEAKSKYDTQRQESTSRQESLPVETETNSSGNKTHQTNKAGESKHDKVVHIYKGIHSDVKMTTFHGYGMLNFDVHKENLSLRKRNDFLQDELIELRMTLQEQKRVAKQEKEDVQTQHKNEKTKIFETAEKLENEKQQLLAENESLKTCNKRFEIRLKALEKERNDLLTRFSKAVSEKLTAANPNVVDLSDMNRPSKLAEVYTELYDNEWTDALESLAKTGYTEREVIDTLKETLIHVHIFCARKSESFVDTTKKAFGLSFSEIRNEKQAQSREIELPKADTIKDFNIRHKWRPKITQAGDKSNRPYDQPGKEETVKFESKVKHLQKELSMVILPVVTQAYMLDSWDEDCVKEMEPYIEKCLFLCWMMAVQDPPLVFNSEFTPNDPFKPDTFKTYQKSGKRIAYVVWPPMLLHEGGPVICKGIAEGDDSK